MNPLSPLPRLHPNIYAALLDALDRALEPDSHGAKVVEYHLKANKKWGSRDRKVFAQILYDIIRWRTRIAYAGDFDAFAQQHSALPQALLDTWLLLCHEQAPKALLKRWHNPPSHAVQHALPEWLYALLAQSLASKCTAVLKQLNTPAPLFLRANSLKTSAAELQARLAEDHIHALRPTSALQAEDALLIEQKVNLFVNPLFTQGLFEVQDLGSQLIAPFCQVQAGMRVIDACAGSGGKTLHLGALMENKGNILALDLFQWKLDKLRQRAKRAGLSIVRTQVIDSSKIIKRQSEQADRLLLDAPCSGTGVLRRKPDSKWKLSPQSLAQLCETQADILQRYARMTKVGGKMVYATCSLLEQENQQQVAKFLAANPQWQLEEQQTLLPLANDEQSLDNQTPDGFYMARLLRTQ